MPKKTIHWKRDHIDNEGRLVCPVEGCGWKSKPNLKGLGSSKYVAINTFGMSQSLLVEDDLSFH